MKQDSCKIKIKATDEEVKLIRFWLTERQRTTAMLALANEKKAAWVEYRREILEGKHD